MLRSNFNMKISFLESNAVWFYILYDKCRRKCNLIYHKFIIFYDYGMENAGEAKQSIHSGDTERLLKEDEF